MRPRLSAILLLLPLFGACAGKPPAGFDGQIPAPLSQRAAQADPDRYQGTEVRWGGEILSVQNARQHTDIELYSRPLFNNAEPKPEGGEGVRFIARVAGFLDPVEHSPGKRLTVRGRLAAPLERQVGEYPYRYPLVEAELHHLWPAYREPPPPARPCYPYLDPWWPWHPWGPWPHRHGPCRW